MYCCKKTDKMGLVILFVVYGTVTADSGPTVQLPCTDCSFESRTMTFHQAVTGILEDLDRWEDSIDNLTEILHHQENSDGRLVEKLDHFVQVTEHIDADVTEHIDADVTEHIDDYVTEHRDRNYTEHRDKEQLFNRERVVKEITTHHLNVQKFAIFMQFFNNAEISTNDDVKTSLHTNTISVFNLLCSFVKLLMCNNAEPGGFVTTSMLTDILNVSNPGAIATSQKRSWCNDVLKVAKKNMEVLKREYIRFITLEVESVLMHCPADLDKPRMNVSPDYDTYTEGDDLVLTCRLQGQANISMVWGEVPCSPPNVFENKDMVMEPFNTVTDVINSTFCVGVEEMTSELYYKVKVSHCQVKCSGRDWTGALSKATKTFTVNPEPRLQSQKDWTVEQEYTAVAVFFICFIIFGVFMAWVLIYLSKMKQKRSNLASKIRFRYRNRGSLPNEVSSDEESSHTTHTDLDSLFVERTILMSEQIKENYLLRSSYQDKTHHYGTVIITPLSSRPQTREDSSNENQVTDCRTNY